VFKKKEFNNYGSGKESAASRFRHVGLAVCSPPLVSTCQVVVRMQPIK